MASTPSELVQNTCKSSQRFKDNSFWVKESVKTSNEKAIKEIISEIKKIIKEKKHNPLQKLLALDLFHDCLMLKILPFILFSQEKILKRLSALSLKRSENIFHDSSRSLENKSNSELFLSHLLNYIQIWGKTFTKANYGESSLFEKTFLQLKSKVNFPPLESTTSSPSKVSLKTSKKIMPDLQLFEYLENILTLVENLEDLKSDSALELMKEIQDLKEHFLHVLNKISDENDPVAVERAFGINDRINRIECLEKDGKWKEGVKIEISGKFFTGNVKIEQDFENKGKNLDRVSIGNDALGEFEDWKRKSLIEQSGEVEKKLGIKKKDSGSQDIGKRVGIYEEKKITEEKQSPVKVLKPEDTQLKLENSTKVLPTPPEIKLKLENPTKILSKPPETNLNFENSTKVLSKPPEVHLNFENSSEIPSKPLKFPLKSNLPEPVKTQDPKPFNIFDDILDLEIIPSSKPATQTVLPDFFPSFQTQNSNPFDLLPIFSSPSEGLASQVSESRKSISQTPRKPDAIIPNNSLQEALREKDEIILNLQMQNQNLLLRNQALEDSLNKTRELLFSKEKECEEFHVFRNLSGIQNVLEKNERVFKVNDAVEEVCDNEKMFSRVFGDGSGVLFEDLQIRIGFLVKRQSSKVKFSCDLVNHGDHISSIKLAFKSECFEVQIEPNELESLETGKTFTFTVTGKLLKYSSVFPRLLIKYSKQNEDFNLNLKFPLNFCQFSRSLEFQTSSITQEWQELVFAGENHKLPCDRHKFHPNMLKFGKNVEILNNEQLETLSSREFFVFFYLSQFVFALIRIKRKENEAEVEIRSNDVELRKHFLSLLKFKFSFDHF